MQDGYWIVETEKGGFAISSDCMETDPCQHRTRGFMDGVDIWRLLKETPSIKKTQPELWKHFSMYDQGYEDYRE